MDPIHPILPQPLNIPPVREAPRVGHIDRDSPGREGAGRRDRPKRRSPEQDEKRDGVEPDAGGGPGSHIDITA